MSLNASRLLAGRDLLSSLKAVAGHWEPQFILPVDRPPKAFLRVVATRSDRLSSNDVKCLTEWRNRYVKSFLTEFVATEAQTRRWLTDIVGPTDSRILFMVDDLDGRTFGYMGLAFIDWERGFAEADAIVRGGPAESGVMTAALRTVLSWAQRGLGLSQLGVRVRSDNPALKFYLNLGFIEEGRVPLRRTNSLDKTIWVEDPALVIGNGNISLVYLRWPAEVPCFGK